MGGGWGAPAGVEGLIKRVGEDLSDHTVGSRPWLGLLPTIRRGAPTSGLGLDSSGRHGTGGVNGKAGGPSPFISFPSRLLGLCLQRLLEREGHAESPGQSSQWPAPAVGPSGP